VAALLPLNERLMMIQEIPVLDVTVSNRMRSELGDIDLLAKSIQEIGLINPITLTKDTTNGVSLVAGHRRLEALKKIGTKSLEHGVHYLWREDLATDEYRRTAVELEENIRRKQMTWSEEVLGKQRLLQIYEKIYGAPKPGQPERGVQQGLRPAGFGVRKLADMLNEAPSTTSKDLEMAALITQIPILKKESTIEDARRKLASMIVNKVIKGAEKVVITSDDIQVYNGDFKKCLSDNVHDGTVDLVYVDLPYGVDLSKMSRHQGSNLSYQDERSKVIASLNDVALHSFRILKNNRFGIFWFGFNYYTELIESMSRIGFNVNPVPFIWYKNTNSTEDPLGRYANSYDAAIVVSKGSPRFILPGQRNFISIPPETTKIHIAQQPVDLVKKFILDMTLEGNTVCDFMCGSGTSGEAALRSNRKAILVEQNTDSFNFTKSRIEHVLKSRP
jgi:DNA modification methylase